MNLSELHNGELGYVERIEGTLAFRTHLEEMGFVVGQKVTRIYNSPIGTPAVYAVMGEKVALRDEEARRVNIANEPLPAEELTRSSHNAEADKNSSETTDSENENHHHISADVSCHDAQEAEGSGTHVCPNCHEAVLEGCGGCPNCSKPNVVKPAAPGDITIALVGNPNCGKTAFFNAASGGHERTGNYAGVTVTSVVGEMDLDGHHLRIIDLPGTYSLKAYSPEEAYVAQELSKGNVDVIVNVLNVNNLERNLMLTLQLKEFGLPVVGALNMYDEFRSSGSTLQMEALAERLGMVFIPTVASSGEGVKETIRQALDAALSHKAVTEEHREHRREILQAIRNKERSNAGANAEVRGLLEGIYELKEGRQEKRTLFWDRLLVSSPVSYIFFLLIMWVIFQLTFFVGQYPMDWIEAGVDWLKDTINGALPEGWLNSLLTDGIIGGVGAVIVFLPNILILYLLISLLEDSGYLARAATLADPLLKKAGLHGKSFIPMLMGFGCNVPAVMATRTIESRKSRLVTMLVIPFMPCNARIPVFLIFAGAFFPQNAGTVLFLLYMGGIVVAFLSAILINKLLHKQGDSHFVLEIPPYRFPMAKSVLSHAWERGREYLYKMGHVILVASIIIWVLQYFPRGEAGETEQQQQEQSYLATIGKAVQPAFAPLGYNWQMTTSILTGISAKELMVSTLGVIYGADPDEVDKDMEADTSKEAGQTSLAERIKAEGTTPAQALSFLIFALLYIPCIATIAALKNESGSWKYALWGTGYTFVVAYIVALLAYWIMT